MSKRVSTAERILAAGRRIFNKKGYAATTLTEIAADVGISQGNLTYHFPTKKDLLARIIQDVRQMTQARRATTTPGPVIEDYVEHLCFAMSLTRENRFIFRDRSQFESMVPAKDDPEMSADFDELRSLLERLKTDGLFRSDPAIDLAMLTRCLWIASRYWMDHLQEFEGVEEATAEDQMRGVEHHLAMLLPHLKASARKRFEQELAKLKEAEQ